MIDVRMVETSLAGGAWLKAILDKPSIAHVVASQNLTAVREDGDSAIDLEATGMEVTGVTGTEIMEVALIMDSVGVVVWRLRDWLADCELVIGT